MIRQRIQRGKKRNAEGETSEARPTGPGEGPKQLRAGLAVMHLDSWFGLGAARTHKR